MTKVSGDRPKGTRSSKIRPDWKTKDFGRFKPKKRPGDKPFVPAATEWGPRQKCAHPQPGGPNPVSGYLGPRLPPKPKKAPGGFQMGDVGEKFQMGDVGTPFPMTKPPRKEQEHLDELEDYQRPQYEPDWFGEIRKYTGPVGSGGGRKPKRAGDLPFEL